MSQQKDAKILHHQMAKEATRKLKNRLDRLKENTRCFDCHGIFPPYVLNFYLESTDVIVSPDLSDADLEELAYADIVCANCLRIRAYNQRTHK